MASPAAQNDSLTVTGTDWTLYRRLLSYVSNWRHFVFSFLGFLLYSIAAALLADLLQLVIDTAGGQIRAGTGISTDALIGLAGSESDFRERARLLIPLAMFVVITIRGIGFLVGNYYINSVARGLVHHLRCAVFDKLLRLPASYFDGQASGHLLSRITFNVEQVTGAATDALKVLMREGLTVIALLAFMFYLNWQLTLLFFAIAPVIALIVTMISKLFRRYSRRIQASMGDVTHVANETIRAYRDVRVYSGSEYERQRFHSASEYNRRQSLKMALTSSASPPVIQILVGVAMGFLIYLVLPPSPFSSLTSGQLVAFLTAAGMLAKPIRSLSDIMSIIQRGLAAAEDIFSYLDAENERDQGEFSSTSVRGEVCFEQVGFAYPDGEQVLHDISFTAQPGQTIAIVGGSGSGKSTLVNVLCRFYDHTCGRILLDGTAVENYTLSNLRSHIAFVSQNINLFNDSIHNNIAYGGLASASKASVQDAARRANADGFIHELPDGYDTVVGEDGLRLSGGQRQRIAIARALLKDAPLLILDEATSALDNESEQHIQSELLALMHDRTTFVIAHRLSTIEQADLILVLEDGNIIEQGTHTQLLAAGARYAQLHQRNFAA